MIYLVRAPVVVVLSERRAILGLDDDVDAFMCAYIPRSRECTKVFLRRECGNSLLKKFSLFSAFCA